MILAIAAGIGSFILLDPPIRDWLKELSEENASPPSPPRAVPVEVAEATVGRAERTYRVVGEIVAEDRVHLTSEVRALVEEIAVEDGERVSRGQLLAQLDDSRARAMLEAAEARAKEARAQYLRARALVDKEFVTEAELDQRQATLEIAEAEVAQAKADLADHAIRAPFAGVVGFILISPGALIEPGQAVAQLTTTDRLRVRFAVPERFADKIKIGQHVRFAVAPDRDDVIRARVATVAPTVDPSSRSRMIEAVPDDEPKNLAPGQFVEVSVVLARQADVVFVPETAIVRDGLQTFVYRIDEDGTARRQAVEVGIRRDGQVELRSGLEPGQRVVVQGLQKISDGIKVTVMDTTSPRSGKASQPSEGQ